MILKHWCAECGVYHCADRVSPRWRILAAVVLVGSIFCLAVVR